MRNEGDPDRLGEELVSSRVRPCYDQDAHISRQPRLTHTFYSVRVFEPASVQISTHKRYDSPCTTRPQCRRSHHHWLQHDAVDFCISVISCPFLSFGKGWVGSEGWEGWEGWVGWLGDRKKAQAWNFSCCSSDDVLNVSSKPSNGNLNQRNSNHCLDVIQAFSCIIGEMHGRRGGRAVMAPDI